MSLVHNLWLEPRIAAAPGPRWQDWAMVALIIATIGVESLVRAELPMRPLTAVITAALVLGLPWRRCRPLPVVLIVFGINTIFQTALQLTANEGDGLISSIFLLMLPYALFRWGSGREAVLGLAFMVLTAILNFSLGKLPFSEVIGGSLFLLFPCALGATVRYREAAQSRDREQVRLRERERLARELHDTVAHHVSAIAIQAQAGRALAETHPQAPVEALGTIEAAASKTLIEMRRMVRAMRDEAGAELSPGASLADVRELGANTDYPIEIDLKISEELGELDSTLVATLYRLTQESITNSVRHGAHVQRLAIKIFATGDEVHFTAEDDGDPIAGAAAIGLGLTGMAERAELLGGSLSAGPSAPRGWRVTAQLPMNIAAS